MFNLKSIIFIFLLSIISSDNNIYVCKTKDTEKKIEIGNDVTLCIHAVNLARKVAFKIKVDDYSVISIKDGFLNIINSIDKKDSETEKETNTRRLDNRNLLKENYLGINGSSSNEISNDTFPEDSSIKSEGFPTDLSTEGSSNIASNEITNILTSETTNISYQETTNIPTDISSIIPSSESTNIQTEETQSDNTSEEVIEEIKEEFIGQIGNIRTKFPTVRNINNIFLFYFC